MSFASLKKASVAGNSIAKLTQEIEKLNQPQTSGGPDERFWKPEMDKSGNGYAVIRFLPAPDGEDMPWAKVWSHAFKGPGGQWYIENSLTTLGKEDPVSELNRTLWNSGRDSDKEIARAQKRKLSYYANIYVKQCYSLVEFEDAKNFKTYEQLQARLNLVLGNSPRAAAPVREEEEEVFAKPMPSESWGREVSEFREKAVAASPVEDDEDDALSYFARLAEED